MVLPLTSAARIRGERPASGRAYLRWKAWYCFLASSSEFITDSCTEKPPTAFVASAATGAGRGTEAVRWAGVAGWAGVAVSAAGVGRVSGRGRCGAAAGGGTGAGVVAPVRAGPPAAAA